MEEEKKKNCFENNINIEKVLIISFAFMTLFTSFFTC